MSLGGVTMATSIVCDGVRPGGADHQPYGSSEASLACASGATSGHRGDGGRRGSTTLDLYTRRTDNPDRILDALTDWDDEDPDDGAAGDLAPV
jgi:hypothetical protein